MTRKTVSEKRKFLDMLQECIDDGSIQFKLDTGLSDDYISEDLQLIIQIETVEGYHSYTLLSKLDLNKIRE